MTVSELLNIRLYNQLLAGSSLKGPSEVVSWMGAMQAQALELAKWGIGVRLDSGAVGDVEAALNSGEIVRTHILRPTWHFVTAEDIYWMAELSRPRLAPVYESYCRMSGADMALVCRTVPHLEKILRDGKHLTKEEINVSFANAGITLDDIHLRAVISSAEVEGMICNGRLRGNKQTFTLLSEWVTPRAAISEEEALERLAGRYFTSHGPATLADFVWWSGLTMTQSRKAVEMIKHDFISEKLNGREFLMRNDIKTPPADEIYAHLLPSFDEFVVSYRDRSEIVEDIHYAKVMTKNGLFSSTIMLNGEIIGSWKKITNKGVSHVELSFFKKPTKKIEKLFDAEKKRVEIFFNY